MTEQDFRDVLSEALTLYMDDDLSTIQNVRTFQDCGLLTVNEGLVVSCRDGSEFHVTIVRSK